MDTQTVIIKDEAHLRAEISALLADGKHDDAISLTESVLGTPELQTISLSILAIINYQIGAIGTAIKLFENLEQRPDVSSDLGEILAVLHCQVGNATEALYYAKLSATTPRDQKLLALLGEGFPSFATAFASIRNKPLIGLAKMVLGDGRFDKALHLLEQHLSLQPWDVEALDLYAATLVQAGNPHKAIGMLRSVITIAGPTATIMSRLGQCLTIIGSFAEAQACHVAAIARAPTALPILCEAAADLRYVEGPGAQAADMVERLAAQTRAKAPKTIRPAPKITDKTRIRIGYLCSNVLPADQLAMIAAIARNHDRSRFSVVGFGSGEPEHTGNAWMRAAFDSWRDIGNLDEATLAALIRGEAIGILVEADGLKTSGRPGLFQRNAAALQVSWLNGPTLGALPGTYLKAVAGSAGQAGELALPMGRYCYTRPNEPLRPVGDKVLEAGQSVTFGATLEAPELSPHLALTWARILHAVPDSVLVLHSNSLFSDPSGVDRMINLFGNGGVAHRIEFIKTQDMTEFGAIVDVALMPFPASNPLAYGHLLQLGVPVVISTTAHEGNDLAAALAATPFGQDLIATNTESYVAVAQRWAMDADKRSAFRTQAPALLAQAPAFALKGFMAEWEGSLLAALDRLDA
ncbi:putative TPR repeat [Candidatus Terasakiella magnetica]|nr:putative TPR repeat [Candidatus Terasakiella magnetica]